MPIYRITIFERDNDNPNPVIGPAKVSARDYEQAVVDVIIHTTGILLFNTNDLIAVAEESDDRDTTYTDSVAHIMQRYHARPDHPVQ